jgi:8-oxo-dGTP pyrophosphatase MutT (NUDIX family)
VHVTYFHNFMQRVWKPHATVAAIIERDGKFLLVEEETDEGIRYNQPAGHLDDGESLPAACARETLEETAWHFSPTALTGIYQWGPARKPELTYLRFAFCGSLGAFEADRRLDSGILRAVWLSPAEIEGGRAQHRSPLVWQCVQDYLTGRRYPLELLQDYGRS